jgi:hypothetical protein
MLSACVCSHSYPACEAHAPCCIVICGLSVFTIFLRIISRRARVSGGGGGIVTERKMRVLTFSTTFISNTPAFKKHSARYYH